MSKIIIFANHSMFYDDIWISPSGAVTIHLNTRYLTETLPLELHQSVRDMFEFKKQTVPEIIFPSLFIQEDQEVFTLNRQIECVRWEPNFCGKTYRSIDKYVEIKLHPNYQTFTVIFPCPVHIENNCKFSYTKVKQELSSLDPPVYWLYPLAKLLLSTKSSFWSKKGEEMLSRSKHIETKFYVVTDLPNPDMGTWNPSHPKNIYFSPNNDYFSNPNPQTKIWFMKHEENMYRNLTHENHIECLYRDKSLFRTSQDFRFVSYYSATCPEEDIYLLESNFELLTNHKTNITYPMRLIVSNLILLYQNYQSSLVNTIVDVDNNADDNRTIRKTIFIHDVGEYTLYSNGSCKFVLKNQFIIELPRIINDNSIAKIWDQNGDVSIVRVVNPIGFERFVPFHVGKSDW